jgi:hypothetical protein
MPVDVWWYALVFQTLIFRVTLDTQYSFMSSVELFWGPDRKQRTKFLLILCFFFLALLGFEIRDYTLIHFTSPFFVIVFFR